MFWTVFPNLNSSHICQNFWRDYCKSIRLSDFYFSLVSRKYLSDPIEEVRIATENLLADFLHEIRDVTYVAHHLDERESLRKRQGDSLSRTDTADLRGSMTAESYDGTVLEVAESPFEANGTSDEGSGSPIRDEKGNGGIILLYFNQKLSLTLRNGSTCPGTRRTHQLWSNN